MKFSKPRLIETDAAFLATATRNAETLAPICAKLGSGIAIAFDSVGPRHPLRQRNLPRLLAEALSDAGKFHTCIGAESQRWYFVETRDLSGATLATQQVLQRIGLLRFSRLFAIETGNILVELWPCLGSPQKIFLNGTTCNQRAGAGCKPPLPQLDMESKTREIPRTNQNPSFLKRLLGIFASRRAAAATDCDRNGLRLAAERQSIQHSTSVSHET